MDYQEERFLILTKTYPTPSKSYRETVCVAAINENGDFRRLFPIQYRFLGGDKQFKRWQWITAKVARSSDKRPESFNIDNDSIKLQEVVGTEHGWSERLSWINKHTFLGFEALERERINNGTSLGIIRPEKFSLIIQPSKNKEWSKDQLTSLRTEGFFDNGSYSNKPIVKKLPFDFYYEYSSSSDSISYKHMITDWEIGAFFWKCQERYGSAWEEKFRQKLEEDFSKKSLLLLLGTIHRFPKQWLIIGLIYPPSLSYQSSFLPQL